MSEFTLQAIIEGDSLQLGEVFASITATEVADALVLRQQLAADLLGRFSLANSWHPQLQTLQEQFKVVAVKHIVSDDSFYCSSQQPLREFLETIAAPASHWCPRDSKPNQQLFDKLKDLLLFATQYCAASTGQPSTGQPTDELTQQLEDFNRWMAVEDKRATMLETRLCETELANLKLTSAENRVVDALNYQLAERPLPTDLHGAIASTLKSELQYWAFNSDPAELPKLPLWKSWQRLLPALGQLFACDGIEVDDQLLYEQIPKVLAELERSLAHPSSNAPAYALFVEQLSRALMSRIQKQPLECSLFPALAGGQTDTQPRIPKALLQQTDSISPGAWILFAGEDKEPIRCKLALKNPELDQLLFVDHTGRKVMSKTNKDFALCLSTGIARPLPSRSLDAIIHDLLPALIERANRSLQAHLLMQKNKAEQVVRAFIAQQQAAAEAAEREQAAAQVRMQQQLEARRAAARKALLEARALADDKKRREAEQAAEAERLRIEQAEAQVAEIIAKQQQAAQSINELQVGAWLEIANTGNREEILRAKLSVIISSTGKYIFADQVGRKVAEHTREQLVALMVEGHLKVVRNGDNFEDQLAKVIRGLRRDVS